MAAIGLQRLAGERDYGTVLRARLPAPGRAACSATAMLAGCCRVIPAEVQVIRFLSWRNRMPVGAFALAVALAQPALGRADEEAERLKLRALTEEGDLILEEVRALQPAADTLSADATQLDAEDASVRAESASLNEAIAKFNAGNIELERQVKAHQAACPRES